MDVRCLNQSLTWSIGHIDRWGKNRFINGMPRCNINSKVQILEKSKVLTVKSRSETYLNKTWQSTAFAFVLEVALPGKPKMHPDVETGWHQLRTPKRSVEIFATRVFASLCNQRARQIYKPLFARNTNLFRLFLLRIVSSVFVISKVTVVNEASILGRKLVVFQGKGSFHFAVNLVAWEFALKLQLIVWLTFPLLVTSPREVCMHLFSVFVLVNTRSVQQSIRWRN